METLLLQCLFIRNDLEEAKSNILTKGLWLSIAHIKTAFLAFHNLCELERGIRPLYVEYRELSGKFRVFEANAKLFSYLRNKFVGHLTDDLVEKALEWKPELRLTLDKEYDPNIVLAYNCWILETAINTYVDDHGRHKVFNSETDLQYPPDEKRFRDTLLRSIDHASDFLKTVEQVLRPKISMPKTDSERMKLFMKAGLTDFEYLNKKGR